MQQSTVIASIEMMAFTWHISFKNLELIVYQVKMLKERDLSNLSVSLRLKISSA